MLPTKLLNAYSREKEIRLEILSRMRPLSTLKALIKSVEVNNYTCTFAIACMEDSGIFTEDNIHFINMDHESAAYVPLSVSRLHNGLAGIHIFKLNQPQVKELEAARLISGCLRAALIHLTNGLEDNE